MSKPCRYCGLEIFWSEEDDRWVPYEDEARTLVHDCPKKPGAGAPAESKAASPAQPLKKSVVKPLTDEEIIFVRKLRWQLKGLSEGATPP